MSHHHRHESNVDRDERAVTKWLNTMEASLADPEHRFSMAKFSPREIDAVNSYIKTHGAYLDRYKDFLPAVEIVDHKHKC